MGVPSLMMILEPNIVWEKTRGQCEALGKVVESLYCPGEFFEGWHKAGKLVSDSCVNMGGWGRHMRGP